MAGVKRPLDKYASSERGSSSPYMPMFEHFRDELDEHHDRRERIIKASRDITALSKKMIFSLQRVHQLNQKLPDNVAAENAERKKDIAGLFESISQDLDGINAQRYQRQVSGAIQEYIEAVSLEHYITNQALIAPQEASKLIAGGVQLIGDDYLLGIFDLTGELMRFAITQMATLGSLPGLDASDSSANDPRIAGMENIAPGRNILMDLRLIRAYFESLDTSKAGASAGLGKDIEKKMEVMKTCVEKVENAAYGMFIRGRERPKGWVPVLKDDRTDAPEPVESY